MPERALTRRSLLGVVGSGAVALAGCTGNSGPADGNETGGDGTTPTPSATQTPGPDVAVVAEYPAENGTYREREVITAADIDSVGEPQQGGGGRPPYVPVTLTEDSAREFAATLRETGFTDGGVASCRASDSPEDPGWCLHTVVDGETVYSAGLSPSLADLFTPDDSGEVPFVREPKFVMQTSNYTAAEELKAGLESN